MRSFPRCSYLFFKKVLHIYYYNALVTGIFTVYLIAANTPRIDLEGPNGSK